MVELRGTYLIIPLLILSWTVMPILGVQVSRDTMSSFGTVTYPPEAESQLGVFEVASKSILPSEADWIVAMSPGYGKPNLLYNPGFELGLYGWMLITPSDTTPMSVDTLPGYVSNSVVMVSNELGYKAGLSQNFRDVDPNTTFHFRAMIKTVDIEALEARALHWGIYVDGKWFESGSWGIIKGSKDWTLYEASFTSPNETAHVWFYPALVYNRGEVWIDEASLTIEGWQPPTTPVILNWLELHKPYNPFNPLVTEADIEYVEQGFKTIPTENFWGIVGPICEETYRILVEFNDDVDTTWFGENLLGYPLYLAESPDATVDQWKDEMFLRIIRGFYNYFSPLAKVGITANGGSIVNNWKNQSWSRGISLYFGEPAMNFIREHYDFVILYTYTKNLEEFSNWTSQYFQLVDQLFQKQNKLWILTRIWTETWEPEAMALEMKNCLDRNIVITLFSSNDPPLEEIWPLMLRARELYDAKAPYYETPVYGNNLLTGFVGDTYGWVEVSE